MKLRELFLLLVVCIVATNGFYSNRNSIVLRSSRSSFLITGISQVPFTKLHHASVSSPQSEAIPEKKDNMIERWCIFILSSVLTTILPDRTVANRLVRRGMSYTDFVKVTKALLRLSNAEEIKNRIVNLLSSLFPIAIRSRIQWMAEHQTKFLCEKSSLWMSFGWLSWLVGPCRRFDVAVPTIPTRTADWSSQKQDPATLEHQVTALPLSAADIWQSGVKLEKCRYLSEAGCKSACIHLCKRPTEAFFNDVLKIPLYMKPDFETSACELNFGVAPPSVTEDPAYREACFTTCPTIHRNRQLNEQTMMLSSSSSSASKNSNHKLRTDVSSLHFLPRESEDSYVPVEVESEQE